MAWVSNHIVKLRISPSRQADFRLAVTCPALSRARDISTTMRLQPNSPHCSSLRPDPDQHAGPARTAPRRAGLGRFGLVHTITSASEAIEAYYRQAVLSAAVTIVLTDAVIVTLCPRIFEY